MCSAGLQRGDAGRVRDRQVFQPDGQLRSELADVLEVLQALAAAHGMSWEGVVAEATRKRGERGGFDQRIFLEYVEQAG
jgi:hypothetical protein